MNVSHTREGFFTCEDIRAGHQNCKRLFEGLDLVSWLKLELGSGQGWGSGFSSYS